MFVVVVVVVVAFVGGAVAFVVVVVTSVVIVVVDVVVDGNDVETVEIIVGRDVAVKRIIHDHNRQLIYSSGYDTDLFRNLLEFVIYQVYNALRK